MRAAASENDVLRAVTEELRRLKLRGSVILFGPDGRLEVRHVPAAFDATGMV